MTEIEPQLAEVLTRWTVRVAIACYLGRVAIDLGALHRHASRTSSKIARVLWTIGCIFYLLHVVCAFEFVHDWSHQHAFTHTAAQTAAITGMRWGGGLFINYAFTFFWVGDVVAWWLRDPNASGRSPGYCWTLHGVFAFMVFNATVVFGPSIWRAVGPVVVLAFVAFYLRGRHQQRSRS